MGNLHATKCMKQNNYLVMQKKNSLYNGLHILQSSVMLRDMKPYVKWLKKSENNVFVILMTTLFNIYLFIYLFNYTHFIRASQEPVQVDL